MSPAPDHTWVVFIDGPSNSYGSKAGVILENNCGLMIEISLMFEFSNTNNQVEHEAVMVGISLGGEVRGEYLKLRTDSQLVISQIWGKAQAKDLLLQ